MTQIFDNLLPAGYADQIENDVNRTQFPWYFVSDVTNRSYGNNSGFVHLATDMGATPTEWYPFIKPMVYSIEEAMGYKISQLLRIRVGLLMQTHEQDYNYNTPHVDFLFPHHTACYYVNDTDGDTVVFNETTSGINPITEDSIIDYVKNTNFTVEKRSSPKKNRLCVFDGLQFHSSSKPQHHEKRIVITVNYIPEHYA